MSEQPGEPPIEPPRIEPPRIEPPRIEPPPIEPPRIEQGGERRRDAAAAVAVILIVVGAVVGMRVLGALAPKPTREQCEQLLAHYLDRASRQHHPGVDDRAVHEALAAASADPARGSDLLSCQRELTAAQVACGLRAPNVDELERCLQ